MNTAVIDRDRPRCVPLLAVLLGALIAAECQAQINILEPRGGDTYRTGDNLTIRWECRGATMATHWDVSLLLADGSEHLFSDIIIWQENWSRVRRSLEGDRLECLVHNVPLHNLFSSGDYIVRVRGSGGFSDAPSAVQVEQTESFRIDPGRWIDVHVAPSTAPRVHATQRYVVSWSSHNTNGLVTLRITVPSFRSIAPVEDVLVTGRAANGSYEWTAAQSRLVGPDLPDPDTRWFVVDNGEVQGRSQPFTVAAPFIAVLQPTEGVRWRADQRQTVRWTAPNLNGDVRIKLMLERPDGRLVNYDTIVERTANDGEYPFTLFPREPFEGDIRTTIPNMRVIVEAFDSPPPFREPARGQSELFTLTETSI